MDALPDLATIAAGLLMVVLGFYCARLELRECVRLPRECTALGPVLFDAYRGVVVAGAVTTCLGLVNLLLPLVADALPAGVSWSWKCGTLFFLACRVHYYRVHRGERRHVWHRLRDRHA